MAHANHHPELGARLKRMRQSTGLSQEIFADRVGVTRRHLIRLENGENRPSRALASRIEAVVEEITGARTEQLLGDADEETARMAAGGPLTTVELELLGDLMGRLIRTREQAYA